MVGPVRTHSPEIRNTVQRRPGALAEDLTAAAEATGELACGRGSPALVNDLSLTRLMVPTLESVLGKGNVLERPPSMGDEDFAIFAGEGPGFFFWLGVVKEGTVTGPHHSPSFRADDTAIPVGIRARCNLTVDYLRLHPDPR